MVIFHAGLAELSQSVRKHRRLGASVGFRESLKARPIYSPKHIGSMAGKLRQCSLICERHGL